MWRRSMTRPLGCPSGSLQSYGWRSRDRIVAPLGQGVAAEDPEHPHPRSAGPPISLDRLVSVLGAGRVVAAGAGEEVRQGVLVAADQAENEGLHANSDRSAESQAEFADLRHDLREGGRKRGRTGDQHDVEVYSRRSSYRIIRQQAEPRRLADPAPGSIAGDSPPDLPAGADTDPGAGGPPGRGESHHGARRVEATPAEQALKIAPGGQTRTLFQPNVNLATGQVFVSSRRAAPGPCVGDSGC